MKRWISTPKPLAGAPPASKPAQNLRSQPHGSRRALSLWCWLDKPAKASVAVDRRDKVTRTGEDVQDLPFFACSRFNRKPVVFAEQFSAYYVT